MHCREKEFLTIFLFDICIIKPVVKEICIYFRVNVTNSFN